MRQLTTESWSSENAGNALSYVDGKDITIPTIDQTNYAHFAKRFNHFYDSVIRKFEVTFRFHGSKPTAVVVIAVRDAEGSENHGWVWVRFEIDDVIELCCTEKHNLTYTVLSEALHIGFFGGSTYLDFGTLFDLPEPDERHRSLEDFRRSAFYIAGRKVTWHLEPYRE